MCAGHDAALFSPLENVPFTGTREQLFLIGFRALCIELYRKRALINQIPIMRAADRGRPLPTQLEMQSFVRPYSEAVNEGMARLEALKLEYDRIVRNRDYSSVNGLVIEYDRPPEIMSCGMIFPEFDFSGVTVQDLVSVSAANELAFCLLATDSGGASVLSWIGEKPASRALATSLKGLQNEEMPHAALRLAFEHFENTFFSAPWWAQVPDAARRSLWNRLLSGTPFHQRDPRCLVDDGLRLVGWRVVAVRQLS